MGRFLINLFRASPLGILLPGWFAMMAVGPEDAVSNISKWLHFFGWQNVPAWLTEKAGDARSMWIVIAVSIVYAGIVWGLLPWRRRRREAYWDAELEKRRLRTHNPDFEMKSDDYWSADKPWSRNTKWDEIDAAIRATGQPKSALQSPAPPAPPSETPQK